MSSRSRLAVGRLSTPFQARDREHRPRTATILIGGIVVGMLAVGCGPAAPLVDIGEGWYVDQAAPGRPASHLYHEVEGTRRLVDRQIEAYRMYYRMCLVYQVSRPEGIVLFGVVGHLTPIAITAGDVLQPWRLDGDALRRFDRIEDAGGRTLLRVAVIKVGDICTAMQMQPPITDHWAAAAQVRPGRFKVEDSVLDVNGADSVGNSTLSEAAREGQIATVDELLRAGADADSSNDGGITVLMTAVVHRNSEVVSRLLKAGARVNAQDDRGQTALMWAAKYRIPGIAQLLVNAGADTTIRDDGGLDAAGHVPDGGGSETEQVRQVLVRAVAASR